MEYPPADNPSSWLDRGPWPNDTAARVISAIGPMGGGHSLSAAVNLQSPRLSLLSKPLPGPITVGIIHRRVREPIRDWVKEGERLWGSSWEWMDDLQVGLSCCLELVKLLIWSEHLYLP